MNELLTIQQENSKGKEYFGQQFKKILQEKANLYDQTMFKTNVSVAGEEFAKANRSSFILKSAINDLIKIKEIPENDREAINLNLVKIKQNDPLLDRLAYYDTDDIVEKNNQAITHNDKLIQYKNSIKDLFISLQNILPEGMHTELILRNDMFADLLNWVDSYSQENTKL